MVHNRMALKWALYSFVSRVHDHLSAWTVFLFGFQKDSPLSVKSENLEHNKDEKKDFYQLKRDFSVGCTKLLSEKIRMASWMRKVLGDTYHAKRQEETFRVNGDLFSSTEEQVFLCDGNQNRCPWLKVTFKSLCLHKKETIIFFGYCMHAYSVTSVLSDCDP